MSPETKVDLGAKAEAMLASWPAPGMDDAAWEARAAKIVAAATNAPRADDAQIAALFAKPALDAEPGENQSANVSAAVSARSASGEKAMSDSNPGSPAKPPTPSVPPTSGAVSKRPSLKELAARASQANQAGASGSPSMRPSAPTPLPAESVLPEKQARSSSPSTPAPAAAPAKASVPPPARALEAMKEDSGRVDLNAINQAPAAEPVAAAVVAAAAPAAEAKASEDKPAEEGAKVKNIADARAKKSKKKAEAAKAGAADKPAEVAAAVADPAKKAESESSGNGGKIGILLAILGLAAAGLLFWKNKQPPPAPVAAVVQEKPAQQPLAVEAAKVPEAPKAAPTSLSIDSLPEATPAESAKAPTGVKVAAAATDEAPPPAAPAPTPESAAPLPTATAGSGKPGDLSSAMAAAVGSDANKPTVNADDATPAAGRSGSQTIPEQPPQGSLSAAIRSVLPGAKACVAGADDVSQASVTFSSSGTVSSVNVSGWAAKNGKSECVKAALKGANVGPFSKSSYTTSVPIRP